MNTSMEWVCSGLKSVRVLSQLFLVLMVFLPAGVHATSPGELSYCGGFGQRECCVHEASPSCDSGLVRTVAGAQFGWPSKLCFSLGLIKIYSDGWCTTSNPNSLSECGGHGQRECCTNAFLTGEADPSCDTGLERTIDARGFGGTEPSRLCSNGLYATGWCSTKNPDDLPACGGINQRPCVHLIEADPSCDTGNVETYSANGTLICVEASPCGQDGQRACCGEEDGEFEGIGNAPCYPGLINVALSDPGCVGNCQCRGALPGIKSSSGCYAPTPCGREGERGCGTIAPDRARRDQLGGPCEAGLVEVTDCGESLDCLFSEVATVPVYSDGRCTAITACGGEGQRACCAGDTPRPSGGGACQSGLVQDEGCSGNCLCKTTDTGLDETIGLSEHTCVAETPGPSAEPSTNWTAVDEPLTCDRAGYADLHGHLLAHLAHGGNVFAGNPAPIDVSGNFLLDGAHTIDSALSPDDDNAIHNNRHGLIDGDIIGFGTQDGAIGNYGSPYYNNWPKWTTTTHQQMYYKWLERAWRGGLRLTVEFAVTNEALCRSTNKVEEGVFTQAQQDDLCNNSMVAIDMQLAAARDFEAFVDVQNGGAGLGWFRIVETPHEARQVIADGKLAVILGIEVDNIFNCKARVTRQSRDPNTHQPNAAPEVSGGCPTLTEEIAAQNLCVQAFGETDDEYYVRCMVKHYYNKGVRHVFPVHNFDNAFGAPATWQGAINAGNRASEKFWWRTQECPVIPTNRTYGYKVLSILDDFIGGLTALLGFGITESPIDYGENYSCNSQGMNIGQGDDTWVEVQVGREREITVEHDTLGQFFINTLMDKGMIIDIDHMSIKSIDNTLALARQRATEYPLVATHVQFFDLNQQSIRHERMRTKAQLQAIRNGGGMIAAMLKDDQQDTDNKGKKLHTPFTNPLSGPLIVDDCRHSSKTFAQMYQYAVDVMGGPVALGSDFNGVAGHVGPRFGNDACGGDIPFSVEAGSESERIAQIKAKNKLAYPFTIDGFGVFGKQKTGFKEFDFNVDGLAHVGLLPDLIKDMENIGLSGAYLDALFGSAEQYVQVWERAEAIANNTTVPNPSQGNIPAAICVDRTVAVDGNCQAEASIADGSLLDDTTLVLTQTPPGPFGFRPTFVLGFQIGTTPTTNVNLTVGRETSCGAASCSATVTVVDETPPTVFCAPDVTLECTSGGVTFTPEPPAFTDNCGLLRTSVPELPAVFPVGDTVLTYSATDKSNNVRTCETVVSVLEDLEPPEVNCPATISAECTGNGVAPVSPGVATGSDSCGAVSLSQHDAGDFPMGTTPLTYVATDEVGNTASCQSDIVVTDTTPPQISCPADITAECTGGGAATVRPGAATGSDICAGVSLTQYGAAAYLLGSTPLTYTAKDDTGLTASCQSSIVVEDTTPPTIECPAATVLECTANHSAPFTPLLATGGDICANDGGPAISFDTPAAGIFPLGATGLDYLVTDGAGLTAACTSSVTVEDTTPPTISSITPSPSGLWSPNHKMVPVTVTAVTHDGCDSAPGVCRITRISSNEPQNDLGDGNTDYDWEITGPLTANLRAERSGNLVGRVYTLELECTDQAGNTSTGTTTVDVVHDKRNLWEG